MTVADHLRKIVINLQTTSGHPYSPGSNEDPQRAFAYGYAIGVLEGALKEWERKLGSAGDGR